MSNEMEQFHTRKVANEGTELPLVNPSTGKESGHSIWIRGTDSDEFRRVANIQKRKMFQRAAEEQKAPVLDDEANKLELLASLVIRWSFEIPCTVENVVSFLREAPQIADAINICATKRSLFFNKPPTSSSNSPEQKSN